jgi:hypothetical protein
MHHQPLLEDEETQGYSNFGHISNTAQHQWILNELPLISPPHHKIEPACLNIAIQNSKNQIEDNFCVAIGGGLDLLE